MNTSNCNPWSMDLHKRIALIFRRDPTSVRVFADKLRSQIATVGSREEVSDNHWEWRVILTLWSPLEVIRLLEDSSERANRLRKTSPLVSLLSEDEKRTCLAVLSNSSA
jgi:hypothetical protein